MKKDLRKTFTPEAIEEWGRDEMNSHIRKDWAAHPDAKGYEDKK